MMGGGLVARLGASTIAGLQELSSLVWMARDTASEVMERVASRRSPMRLEDFFHQAYRVGVGSVPLILIVSIFIGLTLALLTGYQLARFGVETLVPAIVAITFAREMGPLLTGIVLAARVGAAYTAELGSMTASAEVDAIEGMGLGPLRYLVAPRFLAILFLTPSLSILSSVSGIAGAAFISSLLLNQSYGYFFDQVLYNLLVKDILSGVAKSFLFGAIIGWIACYKGMATRGGAEGVGRSTTSSVVTSVTSVIACDCVCNYFIMQVLFK